jgi:hypothetical protein
LGEARNCTRDLFADPDNPRRLATPSGGASIDDAIRNANTLLDSFKNMDSVPAEVSSLTQLLKLAQSLQLLQPYFTDLTMNTVNITDQNVGSLQNLNSTIAAMEVTDPAYKRVLDDLLQRLLGAISGKY